MNQITINELLRQTTAAHPGKTAIRFMRGTRCETERSYHQLLTDSNRCANQLRHYGVRPGDRVIMLLRKSVAAVVAHFGILAAGAVAVPLNPGFKKDELAYLFGDAEARLVLVEPDQADLVRSLGTTAVVVEIDSSCAFRELPGLLADDSLPAAVPVTPESPALIIYTSGTTGNPKGAVLSHANLVNDARTIIDIWRITANDTICHALPLFHVHGLCFALHTLLLSGGRVLLLDEFKPAPVVELLSSRDDDQRCSVFMAVPAMYTKLIDHLGDCRPDFSHLRLLTSGSAPLLVKEFQRITSIFGKEPVEREGMSETGMNFSNPVDGKRVPGSIGRPLPGVAVRIVDPDSGLDLEPSAVGEIWLKGRSITAGYWKKERETAAAFAGGWFRTGDLGRVDANGFYYLTDRIKHIIISGGENVSAKEVETVINRIEGIVESAVVGQADEKWGERVVAAVCLKPGANLSEDEVIHYCKEHLHDWKCPKSVTFVPEIPKNTMGKMLKEEIRKLFPPSGPTIS
ncbi:MAG: acyl--CoA ligase [Desulfofustis sp.]|nr:acyl--CoA ligase [Desulfofustis sp.]